MNSAFVTVSPFQIAKEEVFFNYKITDLRTKILIRSGQWKGYLKVINVLVFCTTIKINQYIVNPINHFENKYFPIIFTLAFVII